MNTVHLCPSIIFYTSAEVKHGSQAEASSLIRSKLIQYGSVEVELHSDGPETNGRVKNAIAELLKNGFAKVVYVPDDGRYVRLAVVRHDGCKCSCEFGDRIANVGRIHYAICEACGVYWCIGENLFSSWQQETASQWNSNEAELLLSYRPREVGQ